MAKGRIEFDYGKCKCCLLCTKFCPTNILVLDTTKINEKGYNLIRVTEAEKCIGCAFCAMMCPDSVITVYRLEGSKV